MQNKAWHTYVRSVSLIVPSASIWIFSMLVLEPRMLTIWRMASIEAETANAVLSIGHAIFDNFRFIAGLGVLVVVLLEARASWWPRVREPIVFMASVGVVVATLLFVTWLSVCTGLALPIVMKNAGVGSPQVERIDPAGQQEN